MKRMYKIPKLWSVSFGKTIIGLWKWNNNFWWRQLLIPNRWSILFTSWQFEYMKCSVYKKIEIQWLYHYYFQIIIDK